MTQQWNQIDGWDMAGGVAERTRPYLQSAVDAIDELVVAAREMVADQRTMAVSSHQMALAWDKVTTALRSELTLAQQQVGNQMLLARVEATKQALDNIDWARDFQIVANDASRNLEVMTNSLGSIVAAAEVLVEISDSNASAYDVGSTAIGALAGVLIGLAIATTAPWWLAAGVGMAASMGAKYLWENGIAPALGIQEEGGELFWDSLFDYLLPVEVNTNFNAARSVIPVRDPLVFDLDGDGLELTAASANVLFDHNADGIKTGTGWARADDGFLVRDLNGNGLIDSGRELFGVDTEKSNGQLATQGFDALADLDANGDGQITSADASWGQLQVWRDVNQDGISQAGELSTLDALGITRIGLNGSSTGPQAGQTINNNRVALSTTFTRNGVNRTVGAIDLEANGFFSEIPPEVVDEEGNPVVISEAANALPQMNGSGMVRNLRAAMSLGGSQADELEAAVAAFSAATTRDAQRALLDDLITEWAQTSGYWSSLETYLGGSVTLTPPSGMTSEQYRNMLAVLEAFNGSRFYGTVGNAMPVGQSGRTVNGVTSYGIAPVAQQVQFLQQAYGALKESVYGVLVMQTRLKPYLDAVELTIGESGVQFDVSGIETLALQAAKTDALNAIKDLTDLRRYGSEALQGVGWAFEVTAAAVLGSVQITPELTALLNSEKLAWMGFEAASFVVSAAQTGFTVIGNALNNSIAGNAGGSEYLYGGAGNDTLTAVGHYDVLDGGTGDDVLQTSSAGSTQSTTYIGGAGNDTITGSYYNDTYVFSRGDGDEVITDNGPHSASSCLLYTSPSPRDS